MCYLLYFFLDGAYGLFSQVTGIKIQTNSGSQVPPPIFVSLFSSTYCKENKLYVNMPTASEYS